MKKFIQILALFFVGVLTSSSLIAQTETVTPRFLTLSEDAGVTLPADPTGTSHGVRINRGYGVPETARAVVAQTEAVTPRFLTLSEDAGVTLPADPTGTSHGVRINRGYGVPETARAVVEPEEVEVVVPAPVPPRRTARRRSSW